MWRLARGGLAAGGAASHAPDAVRAVCGIHAQVMSAGELALAVRVPKLARDAVGDLLWNKRLLAKTWAMRGTLHLLAADDLPAFTGAVAAIVEAGRRRGAQP